jgi:hypothetical protein
MLKSSSLCLYSSNLATFWLKIEKRGDEIKKKSSPLKLLSQSQPNFAEMILGWSPFKIVSVSAVLYPRWPPLLKIEISSNGQNCSIFSQKVHTGADGHNFERGLPTQGSFQQSLVEIDSVVSEEIIFLISSPLFSNLHNRSK